MIRTLLLILFFINPGLTICYSQPENFNIPEKLPVFRLAKPKVGAPALKQLAEKLSMPVGEIKQKGNWLSMTSGTRLLELSTKSGAVWFEEKTELWNPKLTPQLPEIEKAKKLAEEFLVERKLLPAPSPHFPIAFDNMGGTYVSRYVIKTQTETVRQLDVQVNYLARVKPFQEKALTLPVVGGGGEFNVTFGNQGKPIGYQAIWREIEGIDKQYDVLPKARADRLFMDLPRARGKLHSFDSYLAYYLGPSELEQSFLYPVYVYGAVMKDEDGKEFHVKYVTIPATNFKDDPSTVVPKCSILPERVAANRPRNGSKDPETDPESTRFEAATTWFCDGLPKSESNAKGFVDEMSNNGWEINFNWGKSNGWEKDWNADDDDWVDAADIVFFSGHAMMDRLLLWSPDKSPLFSDEVGSAMETPGDLWGEQDLEWVIISACGPLQDDKLHKHGGSAVQRWGGAFDGLHQLLGYGTVVYDELGEGASVAQFMKNGETIIHAWFRTARDIQRSENTKQPPNGPAIYAAVLYAEKSGLSTLDDHLWGHGSVAADPNSPDVLVLLWTKT